MADTTSARVAAVLSEVLGVSIDAAAQPSRESLSEWDSVAHVNVIFGLEDEFGVEFTEDEMVALDSLNTIVAAIETKRGGQ